MTQRGSRRPAASVRLAVPLLGLPVGRGDLAVLCDVSISTPGVDVQLGQGQGQGEGQLTALGVGGTLQDVVHGVPASRPTRSDEVCVRGLDISHRSGIIYTAAR